jgi:MFS family permease
LKWFDFARQRRKYVLTKRDSALAPLSEVFGRLSIYHAANITFSISTLASAISPNLTTLIVLRFVAGCAASAPNAVGAGTLADIVPLQFRGKVMPVVVVMPLLGLAVGPMIGAPLVAAYGWRSTVYFSAAAVGSTSPSKTKKKKKKKSIR